MKNKESMGTNEIVQCILRKNLDSDKSVGGVALKAKLLQRNII